MFRGGSWDNGSDAGAFAAALDRGSGFAYLGLGFRCSLALAAVSVADTTVPEISSLRRVDGAGSAVGNTSVSVASGGNWNLAWNLNDTGDPAAELWVQVRRKVSDSPTDFPSVSDPVYTEGFGLTQLRGENGWVRNQASGPYTVNNGKFINYQIVAIDRHGNRSDVTLPDGRISVENTQSCPPGYVGVAGLNGTTPGAWNHPAEIADATTGGLGNVDAAYGHANAWLDPGRDFCVMKYPAKAQTSPTNPEGGFIPIARGEQSFNLISVIPDSRASGRPWTNISQTDSLAECAELNTALLGSASPAVGSFSLISNTQWQVLARSVEANAVNWSGGVVGTGVLARGHSDDSMSGTAGVDGADINDVVGSKALAHPPADVNGFFGTGQSSGEQRRTQTLPNGQVVWDLAGNVWSWVRDLRSDLGVPGADDSAGLATGAWSSFRNGGSNRFSATTNRIFGNFGTGGLQFLETQNAGQLYGGTAEGVLRGGRWNNTSFAGVFSANLFNDLSSANAYTGFRCSLAFSEGP